jgi:uncharacterized membrane protein YgcG
MSSKPNNAPEPRAPVKKKGLSRRAAGVLLAMLLIALALIFLIPRAPAPPPSPARPDTVFVDKVGLVSPRYAQEVSKWLYAIKLFEGVVYIDGKPPEGDLQPWTIQTASEWGVGTEKEDRGLVLFIFSDARVVRAEIGYGLEGALPDVTVKRLLETLVVPAFAQGRYEQGLEAFIKTVYEGLGGDAEAGRQALEAASRPNAPWTKTWNAAWKYGERLLPAVWRFYSQGSALERFGVLAFATPILFFATMSVIVLLATLRMLANLPRQLRALRAGAAGNPEAASVLPEIVRNSSPRWARVMLAVPVVMGLFLFALNAAIAVCIFSMAPDELTRQGRFGGGGVAVNWPVKQP